MIFLKYIEKKMAKLYKGEQWSFMVHYSRSVECLQALNSGRETINSEKNQCLKKKKSIKGSKKLKIQND